MKIDRFIKIVIAPAVLLALLCAGGACASETASASDDPVLASLIARAERENPLLRAAEERVRRADEAVAERTAAYGPKVTAGMAGIWQEDDLGFSVPIPFVGNFDVSIGYKNVYSAAIMLTQAIYTGGSRNAAKEAAKLARRAAVARELRVYQNVCASVRKAYYSMRRAEAKERVALEAMSLAKRHQARAEAFFKEGLVAKGDVLRSKVAVADTELNRIRAQNGVELAITALERAVGGEIDRQSLKGGELAPREMPVLNSENEYDMRAELRAYKFLSEQAEKIARAERGKLLPQILFGGGYATVSDNFFPDENGEWRAGLMLSWTLFDSGEAAARTRQARAQAREYLHTVEDLKNEVKTEIAEARLNLRSAESRLEVAERQVAESKEDYRIAEKRYSAQVGTNLDMLDARLALTNSMTEHVDALYDIETAKSDLVLALGLDRPTGRLAEDVERYEIFEVKEEK